MGQLGYRSLAKGSTLVVLRNLHRLLHLAALCLLLPSLFGALCNAIPAAPKAHAICSILGNVFITYLTALSSKDWRLALLNQSNASARDVASKLAFVFFALAVLVQVKEAYHEASRMMAICADFGVVALEVTVGGMIYAAQRLARSSRHGEQDHEQKRNRGRWTHIALTWGFDYTVRASAWASGIAFWVLFFWPSLVQVFADRHGWLVGGLVVGSSTVALPLLLLVSLLSTEAALYFSCNSYLLDSAAPHSDPLRTPFATSSPT